jgi:hypothetical protein
MEDTLMITIKKPSAWEFVTSSSGALGVEFVAAEGGALYFKDPAGRADAFYYGAAGAGLTYGFKMPKIGKLQLQMPKVRGRSVGALVAPAAFLNAGKLYVLGGCKGNELTESDIQGVCMFLEVGGGMIVGGSAMAMLVGMSPAWLAATLAATPAAITLPLIDLYIWQQLIETATGLLLMAGVNAGIQWGVGGAVFLGGLY